MSSFFRNPKSQIRNFHHVNNIAKFQILLLAACFFEAFTLTSIRMTKYNHAIPAA